MDKKTKKTLIIVGAIEAVILIFCLTISIIVFENLESRTLALPNAFKKPVPLLPGSRTTLRFSLLLLFFRFLSFSWLMPLYLIVYSAKKPSALTDEEREAIQAQAREEARKELEAEMKAANETKDEKK
jgi:hypothetical protein